MGKHAQLIIGPAGSGKSTYCKTTQEHCAAKGRVVHIVNLDPAADEFQYSCSIDVRDLIPVEDSMEEMELGPNGGLVFCMEHLVENIDWLAEQIQDFDEDYLIFDCPGQIELYFHLPVMRTIAQALQRWGYNVCAVYVVDSLIISDTSRFIAGSLMCLAAMMQLELPHINLLSKCDRIPDKSVIDAFLDPDVEGLTEELSKEMDSPKYAALNTEIARMITDYSVVGFTPFDISDEDSIDVALQQIDHAIQYGEDLEVKESKDMDDRPVDD